MTLKQRGGHVAPWGALLWLTVLTAAYFIFHKPISIDFASSILVVVWNIFVCAGILSICGGLGGRLLPEPGFNSLTNMTLQMGLGAGVCGLPFTLTSEMFKKQLLNFRSRVWCFGRSWGVSALTCFSPGSIWYFSLRWRSHGFTHLLYHKSGADFVRQENQDQHQLEDWQALDMWLSQLEIVGDFSGGYQLYRLKP